MLHKFTGGITMDAKIVTIDNGLGCEDGRFVAHFTESLADNNQVAVFGACDEKHSRPTILQMALVVRRFYPDIPIFRNGRRYLKADVQYNKTEVARAKMPPPIIPGWELN